MSYFYLHTNGTVIHKPDIVVDPVGPANYFDSPFCQLWWHEKGDHKDPQTIKDNGDGSLEVT